MTELKLEGPNRPVNRRLFLLLSAMGLFGSLTILPYQLALLPEPSELPVSLPSLILAGLFQTAILIVLAVAAGLWLGERTGLGAPLLAAWVQGESIRSDLRSILPRSILYGAVVAIVVIGLDLTLFQPRLAAILDQTQLTPAGQPAAWKGLLAAFYGGITEEIFARLLVLSLFAWIGSRLSRSGTKRPPVPVLWIATFIAALFFGLLHLPATQAAGIPLGPLVITRALLLNGIPGMLFGWLFWHRGLLSAMAAHFSADIVLHVLLPLLQGS